MMISLGETIARLRKERGITQETLAECMGVTAQTISKWENSATCPDVMLLPVLADFFGVTVDDLYGRCGEEKLLSREEAGEAAMAQCGALSCAASTAETAKPMWTSWQRSFVPR